MADKYRRVDRPRTEAPAPTSPFEIRVTTTGKERGHINYALTLLLERRAPEVVFKALGRAINKAITVAEIVKRRVAGLHQYTEIGSTDITEQWEPLEEGLEPREIIRHVSCISITLTTDPSRLDVGGLGYQPPIDPSLVESEPHDEFSGGNAGAPRGGYSVRGRGRGAFPRGGGRGAGNPSQRGRQLLDMNGAPFPQTVPMYGDGEHYEGRVSGGRPPRNFGGGGRGGRGRGANRDYGN